MTLVLTAVALFVSCLLPMPQRSMFFHRRQTPVVRMKTDGDGTAEDNPTVSTITVNDTKTTLEESCEPEKEDVGDRNKTGSGPKESAEFESCSSVLLQLWRNFCDCYTSRKLLYWSAWWALATCGYNLTVNYVQVSLGQTQSVNIDLYITRTTTITLVQVFNNGPWRETHVWTYTRIYKHVHVYTHTHLSVALHLCTTHSLHLFLTLHTIL